MITAEQAKQQSLKTWNEDPEIQSINELIYKAIRLGGFSIAIPVQDIDHYCVLNNVMIKYGYQCFPKRNQDNNITDLIINWD